MCITKANYVNTLVVSVVSRRFIKTENLTFRVDLICDNFLDSGECLHTIDLHGIVYRERRVGDSREVKERAEYFQES